MTQVLDSYNIIELAHGGATGADANAQAWAVKRGVPFRRFDADWEAFCPQCHHHRIYRDNGSSYCPAQGGIRNQRMLDEFRPDRVICFPGGTGTANMALRAAAAGVKVDAK